MRTRLAITGFTIVGIFALPDAGRAQTAEAAATAPVAAVYAYGPNFGIAPRDSQSPYSRLNQQYRRGYGWRPSYPYQGSQYYAFDKRTYGRPNAYSGQNDRLYNGRSYQDRRTYTYGFRQGYRTGNLRRYWPADAGGPQPRFDYKFSGRVIRPRLSTPEAPGYWRVPYGQWREVGPIYRAYRY